jgi:D-alanyl-lipoteichoic acid acyltransferase DltB (MBOAT superfamily)
MRDALEFIFSGFWTWAGTVVLLWILVDGLAGAILAVLDRD